MEEVMEPDGNGSNFLHTLASARKKIEEALEYLNQLEKFSFVSTYKQATSDHVASSSSTSVSSDHFLNQDTRVSDFCSTPSTSPDESNRILNVPPILSNQQPPSLQTNVSFCNQVPQIIPYETRNLNAYQFSYQPALYGQQMIIVCSSEKLIGNEINHELTPPLQRSAYELRRTPSGVEQTSTPSEFSVHADDSASSGEFPVLSTLTSVSALQTFKPDLNDSVNDNQNTNYQTAVNAVAPQQVTSENNLEYSTETLPPTDEICQAIHPVPAESILRNALLLSDVSQSPGNEVNDNNESTTSEEVAATPSRTVALRVQKRLREKRFACSVCNKKFAGSCDRKRHERIHTGEKPYRCHVCSMSFPREYGLRRHSRTHTGEKPYKCRFCGSGFADSGNRSIHERIHTGEKRFQCRICHNKFRYSSERRTHEKKHIVEKTK